MATQAQQPRELQCGSSYRKNERVIIPTRRGGIGIIFEVSPSEVTIIDEAIKEACPARGTTRSINVYRFDCSRDGSNREPRYLGSTNVDERHKKPFRRYARFIQQRGGQAT